MPGQEQFAQKVRDMIAQVKALTPAVERAIYELLDEARKRIVLQLMDLDPKGFRAAQLQGVKASIDRIMDDFRGKATHQIDQLEEAAFQLGASSPQQAAASAGYDVAALGQVSRSAVSIAQLYTADLVTNIAADAKTKINTAIKNAFLGGQSMEEIVAQIGRALAGEKFSGVFGPIADRARMIAVNEILRVQSISAQARMEQIAAKHKDLQKKWVHLDAAKVPRIMHIAASGQTVPVDKPFIVAGEELMFPRDPNGSPGNTINCHCVSVPSFERQDLVPSQSDRDLLKSLGIQVSAA